MKQHDKYLNPRPKRLIRLYNHFRHRYFDDFFFIHIAKNGGRSIETALKIPFMHEMALEKIERLGRREWERRFTFTVVRNPWDKVVSHFHFLSQTKTGNFALKPIEFKKWVNLAFDKQDPFYQDDPKIFMCQSDWVSDHDGKILLDYICRFENLQDDFSHVCKVLGKKAELPHINASKHKNYRDYYDEESRKIVANWYSKDIQNFNYHF